MLYITYSFGIVVINVIIELRRFFLCRVKVERMIIVTGGAGFIGSNIVKALNDKGETNILVVDDLKKGIKFSNLVDLDIEDYIDKEDFIMRILAGNDFGKIDAIFHQGACSATTEWDGKYMMENNYQYSKALLHYSLKRKIPFLYASSAAIYGNRHGDFIEQHQYEQPLNVYGYSKLLFDRYVLKLLPQAKSQICGFRYFNVYGPGEGHKGRMASVAFHFNTQIKNGEKLKLFAGSDDFKRDFISIADVASVNLWFYEKQKSGIFNCGTGRAESFKAVAEAVLNFHQQGDIEYTPFPEKLKGCYQSFTCADLAALRSVGYQKSFKTVTEGVNEYMGWLNRNAEGKL